MNKIVPSGLKMLFFGACLFAGSLSCFSQNPTQKSDFWNKVRFGGGIGFNFSNGGFNGSIAPSAIYQFNDYVAAGLGANVNFFKFNNQKFWAYGPSAIVLGNPIPQIQLSAEFEQLRVNSSIQTIGGTFESDYWSPALFIGAGYTTSFATVGIRYNVLHDNQDSIYLNAWTPFVRVYF
ncbi:alpha-ketoglutarate decarboxylase [Maribacter sp. 2308TA10-17]|uniref:alpha-ketoglutarate decarboxylase n=1 Tax=Maribacter sp. 2308TA10-17 TaxID=3386276 RepID=UPI0039BD688C